jgi:hypothetical protein
VSETGSVTIARSLADDIGFREIYVEIDGQHVAVLEARDAVTRELPSGRHRLKATNTLFSKTHDIDLASGTHLRFRVGNKAGWGTFGPMAVLGAGILYLTFEREP